MAVMIKLNITFLLLIIAIACAEPAKLESQQTTKPVGNPGEYVSSFKLPEKLDFCGEEVPLEIQEVRERAEREFYLLLQQPGQIMLYLKRSGRLFPMFEKVLKENDVPDDMKYLAVAESALYQARSYRGAVGIWQFMERTARLMGLHVSDYVDERRHPEKSTEAACKYLKQGYKKHKSWIMAATGYNMGHSNVNWSKNFQDGDDYFDLFLNEETSRFIFRIAAIKEIMKNHKKYGFNVTKEELYKPRKVKIIEWSSSIPDMPKWAEVHGTTYKYVKLLNPWIMKRELRPPLRGEKYEIAIPAN